MEEDEVAEYIETADLEPFHMRKIVLKKINLNLVFNIEIKFSMQLDEIYIKSIIIIIHPLFLFLHLQEEDVSAGYIETADLQPYPTLKYTFKISNPNTIRHLESRLHHLNYY